MKVTGKQFCDWGQSRYQSPARQESRGLVDPDMPRDLRDRIQIDTRNGIVPGRVITNRIFEVSHTTSRCRKDSGSRR